jgi:hypothetical protein
VVQRRNKLGWIVAAWAAVVAQAVPAVCCGACDRPCCSGQAERHATAAAEAPADSGGCPACTAATTATAACEQSPRSADHPCRCHLAARQEQPLASSPDSLRNLTTSNQPAPLAAAPPTPPEAIGVSREYLAASLAVPIRPTRILFGVWRN